MAHPSFIPRPTARARAAFAMTAVTLAAACGGQRDTRSDDALRNDLSLTSRPAAGQQVVSPQEMTPGATTPAGYAPGAVGPNGAPVMALAPAAPAPAPTPRIIERERVVYRDRPARRHSSGGGSNSGTYGSSGTYSSGETVVREEPRPTVRTSHTKQGAIIGTAAGAAIGVATSRDKLKGGLLGAVLGGAAGAVIGNNTGVKHETP